MVEMQDQQNANLAKLRQQYFNSQMVCAPIAGKGNAADHRPRQKDRRFAGERAEGHCCQRSAGCEASRSAPHPDFKALIRSAEDIAQNRATDAARLILDGLISHTTAPDSESEQRTRTPPSRLPARYRPGSTAPSRKFTMRRQFSRRTTMRRAGPIRRTAIKPPPSDHPDRPRCRPAS